MPPITLHILDTSRGTPGAGIRVQLERNVSTEETIFQWELIGETVTNTDGRGPDILPHSISVYFCLYCLIAMTFHRELRLEYTE